MKRKGVDGRGVEPSKGRYLASRGLVCFLVLVGLTSGGSAEAEFAGKNTDGQELIFEDGFEDGTYFNWTGAEFGAIDQVGPELFLVMPERPAVYNDDSPLISLGYFDLDIGVELGSLRVELDGTDLLPNCTVDLESVSCTSGPLSLGSHQIEASIWDIGGNRTHGIWSFEVALDSEAPTVDIDLWDLAGSDSGTVYNDPTPVFLLEYVDDLAGVDPRSVSVTVDGTLTVECSAAPDHSFCETPPLAAGSHQAHAVVLDHGGNLGGALLDFELVFDAQPPVVGVTIAPAVPRLGDFLQVLVAHNDVGTGIDPAAVRLLADGVDRTELCTVGTARTACLLPAGNVGGHVIEAFVQDLAGGETRELLSYQVLAADVTPPVVTLTVPAQGEIVTHPDLTLRLAVVDESSGVDPSSLQILLDASDITTSCSVLDDVYSCAVAGLTSGEHLLAVQVGDLEGNNASFEFSILAQFSLGVEITQPADGTLLADGVSVDVVGKADAAAVSVFVNGLPAAFEGGTFSVQNLALHEGTNVLNVVASDALGNVGYDSIEVLVDATSPQLSIEFPRQGYVANEAQVTVIGMVHDPGLGTTGNEQVSVLVDGFPASVTHRSFRAEQIPLLVGTNEIVVQAEDLNGNIQAEVVEVVYEPNAPHGRLVKISGDLQSAPILSQLAQALKVELLDAEGEPRVGETIVFEVVRGDGLFSNGRRRQALASDGTGEASVNWLLGSRAGSGADRVEASVAGVGGVSFTATAEVGDPRSIHLVSGDAQRGAPGQALARLLKVVVTDDGQNPVPGVEVLFEVAAGGGSLEGAESQIVSTDSRGYAAHRMHLGSALGPGAHRVEASFAGQPQLPVVFQASAYLEGDPSTTSLSGVVLDNAGLPVPGYTLRIPGSSVETVSGPEGGFTLVGAPIGHQLLIADGSAASRPGVWPNLEFEVFNLAGVDNRLHRPVYVLPLDVTGGTIAGGPEEALIEIPNVPGFSLRVAPGSVTFPDGASTGVVSATAVHADKIPMAPPEGMQPRFIVTIQPAGAIFNPPAPVTFPNVDGLAPGTISEMFSFDHDLGAFISVGTGTVSDDGTVITSDPGFGITKAGWHCAAPQSGRGQSGGLSLQLEAEDPLVLLANLSPQDHKEVQAEGAPPLDGSYTWMVDDPNIATLASEEDCADQPTCPATVTARSIGQTTARVTFSCLTTGVSEEAEFDIVVAAFQLEELSFSGEAYQEVSDDVGTPYSAPHWQNESVFLGSDATIPPSGVGGGELRRFPVSYRRGTKMSVNAEFLVQPEDADFDSVLVRGRGPEGINFPETPANVRDGELTIDDVEMEEGLADVVAFHNPLVIRWEVSVDDGENWVPAGVSENRVYVTLEDPFMTPQPFAETIFDIGCRNGAGSEDPDELVAAIWNDFSGPIPGIQRKSVDGYNQMDGVEMRYWVDASDPRIDEIEAECQGVRSMLNPYREGEDKGLDGIGTCSAWSFLFLEILAKQGIIGAAFREIESAYSSPLPVREGDSRAFMLVRDWDIESLEPGAGCLGANLQYDLAADLIGAPGQGTSNPPSECANHFLISYISKIYDPSYGIGPFGGDSGLLVMNAWENAALSGISVRCLSGRRIVIPNNPQLLEVTLR